MLRLCPLILPNLTSTLQTGALQTIALCQTRAVRPVILYVAPGAADVLPTRPVRATFVVHAK